MIRITHVEIDPRTGDVIVHADGGMVVIDSNNFERVCRQRDKMLADETTK